MQVLVIIVIICVVIGLINYLIEEHGGLLACLGICIIAFFAYSWIGVLAVIIAVVAIGLVAVAGMFVKDTVHEHDIHKKQTAEINRKTQQDITVRKNDADLQEELNKNCRWLGFMDSAMWKQKLPNYCNKVYSSSFDAITSNFAAQMERQNITQNDQWFHPYLMYCIDHPQGTTATKMLNEVVCQQLYVTHSTPNGRLLTGRLMQATRRVSKDVPPLLKEVPIDGMKENLFVPTKYALKLYGKENNSENRFHQEEMNFDDL